ncbi:DUF3349 domain-containing protein [Gordonia sp. PDNC005]|uniref:DUF3349 domain-containing protein n=1 Tax=unclassified Gordonia (in: high G+C Gram-positive bacteria) TaxID=2657482 RepID=UPI0019657947|nr:DUF3349 domain-containing protein [Gordonia sp. PDNC005]QRY61751.1 DUF3349 domain-containing protein [Gordonia sp. PDNC005]
MERHSFLSTIRTWLRAGYPEGVPQSDYVPLFALLRRQLSEEEIRQVAIDMIADSEVETINRVDVGVEISKVTDELPRDEDVARVRTTLEAAGWPFDDAPFSSTDSPEDKP